MRVSFYLKQIFKMAVQHIYLPVIYFFCSFKKVRKGLVVFADAHHSSCPFSMEYMKKTLEEYKRQGKIKNIEICERYLDFSKVGFLGLIKWLSSFMKLYAQSEYVFICDNFLPVSSCKKRKETKVIQLWHSGGLLKKAGYDTEDSVPGMYKGNVFKNYDLLTVSAPCCVSVIEKSLRQPKGVVKATGISRSDIYFDNKYNEECRAEFYKAYPEAKGKKIALWVPTFRGNAADPKLVGEEEIDKAFFDLKDFFLVKKLHPHFENANPNRVSCKIPSERLLPVTDLLITDYSSIVFDYLVYKKPFVLFAPDLDEYAKNHGFYVDYNSYPSTVAKSEKELTDAVVKEAANRKTEDLEKCYRYHMEFCDGNATKRILNEIGLI